MPDAIQAGCVGLGAGSPAWRARIDQVISEVEPLIQHYPYRGYGNKRRLLRQILACIPEGTETLIDLFGGSHIVGWAAKRLGIRIISNDIMHYSAARARCLIQNNETFLSDDELRLLLLPREARKDYVRRYYGHLFNERSLMFWRSWTANLPLIDSDLKRCIASTAPVIVVHKRQKYGHARLSPSGTLCGGQHLRHVDLHLETIYFLRRILPQLVFNNQRQNQVYQEDVLRLVESLEADACYIDSPYACAGGSYEYENAMYDDQVRISSGNGDLVVHPFDGKSELKPYTRFYKPSAAIPAFAQLFRRSRHIPTLIVSYNTSNLVRVGQIETLARDYGRDVETAYIDYPFPTTIAGYDAWTQEVLIVCRSRRAHQ